jgi:hypothetical protein
MTQLALHAVAQAIPGAMCSTLMMRSAAGMPPFENTLGKQQIENVAAYVTTTIARYDRVFVAMRRRGPCVHNDQGVDRREERRDARV